MVATFPSQPICVLEGWDTRSLFQISSLPTFDRELDQRLGNSVLVSHS